MVSEKIDDFIAKTHENYISKEIDCLKTSDSHRFLGAGLDDLSRKITSFPSLDANRTEDEKVKKELAYKFEKLQTI